MKENESDLIALLQSDYASLYQQRWNWRLWLPRFIYDANYAVVFRFRLSMWLNRKEGSFSRFLSKVFWARNIKKSSCHLSPRAIVGFRLYMPHAAGIVIGEGVSIGDNVAIYQHVTLGKGGKRAPGYPKIMDNVVIYTGAVILGGITIGESSTVGANAVVLEDVPPNTTVVGIPARPLNH